MKTIVAGLLSVLIASSLLADEWTRTVQQRLKDGGFYYGEVDGQSGTEMAAAVRRFQIRHGLQVTGEINDETLRSLGVSKYRGENPDYEQQTERSSGRMDYARSGRSDFGRPGNDGYGEDVIEQPSREVIRHRSDSLSGVFVGTIYERAPMGVLQNVLTAVQGELSRKGFYREDIDGQSGPATSDAIARFQQEEDLRVTGRLNNDTLHELQALPGQRNGPPDELFPRRSVPERVYRGIEVDR
jgi:peptidoglycan hydrolase-like protein with peptidoglycan-binding domain